MGRRKSGWAAILFLAAAPLAHADFSVCSFNAKRLSTDDPERDWRFTAAALDFCDVAAVQSVITAEAAEKLRTALEERSKEQWGVALSEPLGHSRYKEMYAVYYRLSAFSPTGHSVTYSDPADLFERSPFAVELQYRGTSVVVATVHTTSSGSEQQRKGEITHLGNYVDWLQGDFAKNAYVVLAGDFGTPQANGAFDGIAVTGLVPAIPDLPTTLGTLDNQFVGASDHVFADKRLTVLNGFADNISRRFGLPNWRVRKMVSDHLPVAAVLQLKQ